MERWRPNWAVSIICIQAHSVKLIGLGKLGNNKDRLISKSDIYFVFNILKYERDEWKLPWRIRIERHSPLNNVFKWPYDNPSIYKTFEKLKFAPQQKKYIDVRRTIPSVIQHVTPSCHAFLLCLSNRKNWTTDWFERRHLRVSTHSEFFRNITPIEPQNAPSTIIRNSFGGKEKKREPKVVSSPLIM